MLLKARTYHLIDENNKFSVLFSILFLMTIFVIPATLILDTLIDLFEIIPKYFPWDITLIPYILDVIEKLEFFLSSQKPSIMMA